MSIIKTVLASGTGDIARLYANRDPGSTIFAGQLEQLTREHPERLRIHHWFVTDRGVPDASTLPTILPDEDIAQGLTLACQSLPETDEIFIAFDPQRCSRPNSSYAEVGPTPSATDRKAAGPAAGRQVMTANPPITAGMRTWMAGER
ncbi:hypothetical protein ACFYO1_01830 [Nocardia sp. NPDC006044]|uniref:hypothetical protein n=1 Tax=Nocardia sp. NPDC006044 TaxID=3364306 RepID=UPI0036C172B0